MHKLVDALVRLNDALEMIGMRAPAEIWLESREQGLILFTALRGQLNKADQDAVIPQNADFMDWCEIIGIKFRWPPG